jgi:hypothetical protein
VAGTMLPEIMPYDYTRPAKYPDNGRPLTDDGPDNRGRADLGRSSNHSPSAVPSNDLTAEGQLLWTYEGLLRHVFGLFCPVIPYPHAQSATSPWGELRSSTPPGPPTCMADTSIPFPANPVPGATNSCELVTVIKSGMELNDDSGSCDDDPLSGNRWARAATGNRCGADGAGR